LVVAVWLFSHDARLAATITAAIFASSAWLLRPPPSSSRAPPLTTATTLAGVVPPPAERSEDAKCAALRAGLPRAALDGVLQTFVTEATHRAYYNRDACLVRLRALTRVWEGLPSMYEEDGAHCGDGDGDCAAPPRDRIVISYMRNSPDRIMCDDPDALCFKFDVTLNAPMRCVLACPREIDLTPGWCSLLNIGEMLEYAPPIVAAASNDEHGGAAADGAAGAEDARAPPPPSSCGVLRMILGIAMPFPLPHAALRLRMLFHDCKGVDAADGDFDDYGGGGEGGECGEGGKGGGASAAERRVEDGGAPLALVLISEPSPIPPLTLSWGAIESFVWCRPLDAGRRSRFVVYHFVRVPLSFPDFVVRFFIRFVCRTLVPTVFAGIVGLLPTITATDSPYAPRLAADPVWYDDFVANRSEQPSDRRRAEEARDARGKTTASPRGGGGDEAGGAAAVEKGDVSRPPCAKEEVASDGSTTDAWPWASSFIAESW